MVASQPQTTISSEADISRQQRGSQEPSSEFARHISPLDSAGDVVAESNNQVSVTAVHVDSSESLLTENITQSTSVPSQSQGGEEEGEGEGERQEMEEGEGATLVNVVVGVVEPERANQPPKLEEHPQTQTHPEPQQLQLQLQTEQKEQEQLEPVAEMVEGGEEEGEEEDREAIGDVREGETTEEDEGEGEGEEAGVMEEGAHVKDATREQADTTQKLEEGNIQSWCV